MGNESSKPLLAAHVAAAMARAGQCKVAGVAAPPLAPHVAAAISRAGQCKVASVAVQPMKRKASVFDDPKNPSSFAIAEHLGKPVKKREIELHEFELEGDSDDDEVVETAKNFFTAHLDLSSNFGHQNLLTAPKGYGRKKHLKLSDKPAQWKRVDTEYIGEVGAFQVMVTRGYRLGFRTGVMGGRGLDQVWYKGSLSNDVLSEIVVVEAKGPGAKLSKTQRGSSGAKLNPLWVEKNAEIMSRSSDPRKSALGTAITEKFAGGRRAMELRGLIISHDILGTRKVGKMHDLC